MDQYFGERFRENLSVNCYDKKGHLCEIGNNIIWKHKLVIVKEAVYRLFAHCQNVYAMSIT